MKKFFKIVLIFIVVLGLGISLVFYLTAGLPKTAEAFFTAAKNNDYSSAYQMTSSEFRSGTTEQQLINYMRQNSFDQYQSSSWSNRSINMNTGQLVGTISTTDGNEIPIELSFVKSDSEWYLHSIRKSVSGIVSNTANLEVPSEVELLELVSQSMQWVAKSVESESMQILYDASSKMLQQQIMVGDLDKAFSSFYGKGFNLGVLPAQIPSFKNDPEIRSDGALEVAGFYPAEGTQLHFKFSYIREGLSWKILGVNVYTQ